jgi:hypothetical protein
MGVLNNIFKKKTAKPPLPMRIISNTADKAIVKIGETIYDMSRRVTLVSRRSAQFTSEDDWVATSRATGKQFDTGTGSIHEALKKLHDYCNSLQESEIPSIFDFVCEAPQINI